MARKLWITAAFLVLLGVLGKFYAKPVLADAIRATLIQNTDEPGRNTFGLTYNNTTLNAYYATFKVPAGKEYIIDQYSASCDIASSTAMTDVEIDTVAGGNAVDSSAPAHFVQNNGFIDGVQVNYHSGTGIGPIYADPGSTITMFSFAGTGSGYSVTKECFYHIQGHFITL